MRIANTVHQVFFNVSTSSTNKTEVPDGTLVPHTKTVQTAEYFICTDRGWEKVYLSKSMILDLAKQIREIESETIDLPLDSLPF